MKRSHRRDAETRHGRQLAGGVSRIIPRPGCTVATPYVPFRVTTIGPFKTLLKDLD